MNKDPSLHDKLTNNLYAHPVFCEKLGRLAACNADELTVIVDFDNCAIERTTWDVALAALSETAKMEDAEAYTAYKNRDSDELKWWEDTMNNYINDGLTETRIAGKLNEVSLREGFADFCSLLADKNVPLVIVSAGLGNIIEMLLEKYKVKPALIVANYYNTNASGTITGYNSSIIHDGNKPEIATNNSQLLEIQQSRPNAIAVGDQVSDARVCRYPDQSIAVQVGLNPDLNATARDYEISKLLGKDKYHAVSVDGTWGPVTEITQHILSPSASRAKAA